VRKLAVGRWQLTVCLLFLAARIPLLFVRQPFFDELFTRWISAKSFAGIVDALRYDSGPPLYYWLLQLLGDPPLLVMRALSLLFAAIAFAVVLKMRVEAAALLAVFPPAVLLSVDARAYALCAMFVALAILALESDRPWTAAAMLVLAAYSHYYGVLFFPLLWKQWRALAVTIVLFIPGFWLAAHQPAGARQWMSLAWPHALFVRPPVVLAIIACVATAAAAVGGRSGRRYMPMTLAPLVLAIVLGVYVPLRFESVIAVPLALWLAPAKRVILIPLGVAFAAWTALGIVDHAQRPIDDYRVAAAYVARMNEPVVASGYLYLETIMQRPAIAFPPEQAQHPGWRAVARSGSGLPSGAFIWIGERNAPELSLIRRARRIDVLCANARAIVVKVH